MKGAHVILKYDGGTDFINQSLVLSSLFFSDSALKNGLMGQHRREALVIEHNGNLGMCLPPSVDKLLHPRQILRRFSTQLGRLANDDALHLFFLNVSREIIEEVAGSDCHQSVCNDLQRIGDSQSATFLTVVYR